jgi:hypothetical protein
MAAGKTLDDCIDYTSQLGSFGCFMSYLFICTAAPVYLAKTGVLRPRHVAIGVAGALILLVPLLSFVYPLPDAPARYFPYLFSLLILAATAWSLRVPRAALAAA